MKELSRRLPVQESEEGKRKCMAVNVMNKIINGIENEYVPYEHWRTLAVLLECLFVHIYSHKSETLT